MAIFKKSKSGDHADDALMRAIADGDRQAFASLVRTYSPRAIAVAKGVTHDHAAAEDVVQEALLKLWRHAPDWTPGRARISTWLHRVVVNAAIDQHRKHKRRAETDITPYSEALAAPISEADTAAEQDTILQDAIAALPDRQRQILALTYGGQHKNKDVAHMLGVSVKTVEMTLSRARKALRDRLKQDEIHDITA